MHTAQCVFFTCILIWCMFLILYMMQKIHIIGPKLKWNKPEVPNPPCWKPAVIFRNYSISFFLKILHISYVFISSVYTNIFNVWGLTHVLDFLSLQAGYYSTRLRSDVFKGVISAMEVLPLNKQLLLASDNGTITLIA